MKKLAILGSTGSIGTSTLDVIRQHREEFQVVALAAGTNITILMEQIKEFQPELVSVASAELATQLRHSLQEQALSSLPEIHYGDEGLIAVATHPAAEVVVTAVVGTMGLRPTLAAIRQGKNIALANKETLVAAGHLVMQEAEEHGVSVVPVDSEHSAIFQVLQGENQRAIQRIILTASGGAFRDLTRDELEHVTVEGALNHPNWRMGAKVTIDSATMMNKGFEVMEAHWFFKMPYSHIEVLLHDESIIHSMVEFRDQAILAQLGTPDMRVPIQFALTYPDRLPLNSQSLNLAQLGTLHFRPMDFDRYPCIKWAFEVGEMGGTMPAVFNAANEIAVASFLDGRISFLSIENMIEAVLEKHENLSHPELDDIFAADRWARRIASSFMME